MRFPRKNNQPPFLRTAVAEEKNTQDIFWQKVKITKPHLNPSLDFTQNQSP